MDAATEGEAVRYCTRLPFVWKSSLRTLTEGAAAASFEQIREKALFEGDDALSEISEQEDIDPDAETLANI